jgi:hypothetical protein
MGTAAGVLGRGTRGLAVASLGDRVRPSAHAVLDGATEWLNSEPLGPAELRGRVVLVNFAIAFG